MAARDSYYLTGKGKVLLEANLALRPEVLDLLEALDSRAGLGGTDVSPGILDSLLRKGYIGKMEEFGTYSPG